MPIVRPEAVLPLGMASTRPEQPVIVFDFGQMVGMAVSQILDVVDVTLEHDPAGAAPFTLGKQVIFGKTTLLIDVYEIVRQLAPAFVQEKKREDSRNPRVLLVDDSNAMRAALGGFLRATGLDVVDLPDGAAALRELRAPRSAPFDAVVTDLEMPGVGGLDLLETVKKEQPRLPVFVWTHLENPSVSEKVLAAGAAAFVSKMRREDLVSALEERGIAKRRAA
jgi:CheY-like chemotaxis protein